MFGCCAMSHAMVPLCQSCLQARLLVFGLQKVRKKWFGEIIWHISGRLRIHEPTVPRGGNHDPHVESAIRAGKPKAQHTGRGTRVSNRGVIEQLLRCPPCRDDHSYHSTLLGNHETRPHDGGRDQGIQGDVSGSMYREYSMAILSRICRYDQDVCASTIQKRSLHLLPHRCDNRPHHHPTTPISASPP